MPNLNKDFIAKVRAAIADAPPEQFDMNYWFDNPDWVNDGFSAEHELSCGTAGCLAGWAVMVDARERQVVLHFTGPSCLIPEADKPVWARARELMGLDDQGDGSSELFGVDGWPERLDRMYQDDEKGAVLALLDGLLDDTIVFEDGKWVEA